MIMILNYSSLNPSNINKDGSMISNSSIEVNVIIFLKEFLRVVTVTKVFICL